MAEEIAVDPSKEIKKKKTRTKRRSASKKKNAPVKRTAGKKAARKKAPAKKKKRAAAKKRAPAKKRAARKAPARRAAREVVVTPAPSGAPTLLVVGPSGKAEPIWLKYAQMPPTRPSTMPSVRTRIRVGHMVSWRTESGKERIGVVDYFRGDSAGVRVGASVELIRIPRLAIVSVKKEK